MLDGTKVMYTRQAFEGATHMATLPLAAGPHPLVVDASTPYGSSSMWVFCWYAGPDGILHRISNDMLYYSPNGAPLGSRIPHTLPMDRSVISLSQTSTHVLARITAPVPYSLTLVTAAGTIVQARQDIQAGSCRIQTAILPVDFTS